jgi:hypothetical protein
MTRTLMRLFDDFSRAEQAHDALVAAGVPAARVHVVVGDDEAGPVQGNFADVAHRGIYRLVVDVEGDEEQQRIEALLGGAGAA